MASLLLSGCTALTISNLPVIGSEGGQVQLDSQYFADAVIAGQFEHCVYRYDTANNFTVLMYDGSIDKPARAVVISSFWRPTAAKTPIDSNSTNATLQYYAFTEAQDGSPQVGVYSGAGFVYLSATPGADKIKASIWQATVRLEDRSADYDDTLGEANMTGKVIALRDNTAMPQLLHSLDAEVTRRLGYPRL